MKLVLISRHTPTAEQVKLAAQMGYSGVISVGDVDAFAPDIISRVEELVELEDSNAMACVHPNVAMAGMSVGNSVVIWHNESRAPIDEKPTFQCIGATRWSMEIGTVVKEYHLLES